MAEISQKDALLAFMGLATKINDMNRDITEEVTLIAQLPPEHYETNNSFKSLEEALLNSAKGFDPAYVDYVLEITDQLQFIDHEYIRGLMEIRRMDGNMSVQKLTELLQREIIFKNVNHAFDYYQVISNLAISISDSDLIKAAITKVQTL